MKPLEGIAVASIIMVVTRSNSSREKIQDRRTSPNSGCTTATNTKSRKKAAGVEELNPNRVP
ncbi:MAG: hypothetical protein HYW07_22165 [Candidatus Latescibacteria bacterium]|nr:hypothetical protein [Candidatus Latescibacterota bacterium]